MANGTTKNCQCLQNNHILVVMELVVSRFLDLNDDIYSFTHLSDSFPVFFLKGGGHYVPPWAYGAPKSLVHIGLNTCIVDNK